RIARSIGLIMEAEGMVMTALIGIPICFLLSSYLNTLYLWIKIINYVNFSKLVEKVFPMLGKLMIGIQVVLYLLILFFYVFRVTSIAVNITFASIIIMAGVGYGIFGKMIWNEYRFINSRKNSVCSQSNQFKIQKVSIISVVAIIISFCSLGVLLWLYLSRDDGPVYEVILFNVVARGLEALWIVTMILILAPSNHHDTSGSTSSSNSTNDSSHNLQKTTSCSSIEMTTANMSTEAGSEYYSRDSFASSE
ncbi:hypothetical protein SAMD00019534_047020, partial [Acytostelium subglobosum LB1]|uniref:hypothetical protein n=1 Tax=Acytostelium subglobosum LB1 TaxID=1410327 RepID=UPI000644D6D7